MKTDHPIYLFLRSGPEAFRVLTGVLVEEFVNTYWHAHVSHSQNFTTFVV
ncbi:hypothetical protein Thiowin_04485 [Thiorhodovibrio winogradskyi]|uniref:Transposase n=1 Tax=Thiorhodovibrio winogradskyi TaxID=77007 RepID=A0ABZ0SFC9_9GAMM